ncbi:hypothetical protein CR513_21980, partial [Mucuna pruriens]
MDKSKFSSNGLDTPLPIPTSLWVDISMEFVLDFPRPKGGRDSIFVVKDRLSKMTYFIPYHKVDDAYHMANLFFNEIRTPNSLAIFGKPSKVSLIPSYSYLVSATLGMGKLKIINDTTSHSPFELVYGFNLLSLLDLLPLPNVASKVNQDGLFMAQFVAKLYEKKKHILSKKDTILPILVKNKKVPNLIN